MWEEGADPLSRYLSWTHGRRQPSARSPVYGIVAVGKYLRVFKYDDVNEVVLDWSPQPRKMPKGEIWHLEKHCKDVQFILNYIRDHH